MKNKNVEKFIQKYADLVYRVSFTILKNKTDSDDIFQEVFITLCSSNVKFLNKEHEKAWIIKVTRNKCLDYLKSSAVKNKEELNENIIQEQQENNIYVIDEVMKLPENLRIIIYLYYFEGYKINEIAKILNVNESTLKSQLVKAREKLKDRLKEEF